MTLNAFIWSVIASIVAAIIVGTTTYKLINKNKTKKIFKQKGDSNIGFMDSKININSNRDNKGEK